MSKKMIIGLAAVVLIGAASAYSQTIFTHIQNRDFARVKAMILEKPELVQAKDNAGRTPLHLAANAGDKDLFDFLVSQGADIKAKTNAGTTALHYAANGGNMEIIRALIEGGADVKARNNQGLSPLQSAAQGGRLEAVKLLVEKGASAGDKNKAGKTALFLAAEAGKKDVVDYLLILGPADPRQKSPAGESMLHFAARNGWADLAGRLLDRDADPDAATVYGDFPLLLAVRSGSSDCVRLLLDRGADIKKKTPLGATAAEAAVGRVEAAKLLEARGSGAVAAGPGLTAKYVMAKTPGSEPELFAPGLISKGDSADRDISFNRDFSELFFTRNAGIHIMTRVNGVWSEPKPAPFTDDNQSFEAYFTPDEKRIYYITNRPPSGTGAASSHQIWFVDRTKDGWSTPSLLGTPFEDCFYTAFTRDWVMYYTGRGNDLYRAAFVDGRFLQPEKLSENINTPEAEYNSFIAPDESYFIYTTFARADNKGGGDLYINFRRPDGSWTPAVNLGSKINTPASEYCPSVSPDGKFFFFASNRYGADDIFWIDAGFIAELKAEALK
jgi:ankyrin repeat protein